MSHLVFIVCPQAFSPSQGLSASILCPLNIFLELPTLNLWLPEQPLLFLCFLFHWMPLVARMGNSSITYFSQPTFDSLPGSASLPSALSVLSPVSLRSCTDSSPAHLESKVQFFPSQDYWLLMSLDSDLRHNSGIKWHPAWKQGSLSLVIEDVL